MASRIFSALERDKLDHFPEEISTDDLNTYFRLSLADLFAVRDLRGPTNQFGFALQITALRFLGFCPDNVSQAPLNARLFVAQQLGIELADLEDYGEREQTRTEHFKRACRHLGFRTIKEEDSQTLLTWMQERALEHDQPRLLFEILLQKIKAEKLIRPGITVMERWVLSARDKAQQQTYTVLTPLFNQERLAWLDQLLLKDEELGQTRLEWLRFKPFTNSPDAIVATIKKLDFLKAVQADQWDLQMLNPNRRKFLAEIARHSSAQALASAAAPRKYPVLIAFVSEAVVEITDLIVEMFDAYLAGVYSRAGFELREFRLSIAPTANEQMHILQQLSTVVLDEKVADAELRQTIYAQLPPTKLKQVVEICEKLTRPLDDNYFDLLASRYSHIREFAPKFLETLTFQANTATKPLLEALELLRELNREHKRQVPGTAPVSFVNGKWETYVYNPNGTLNRKYYELCVLWELRGAIRGSNVWVDGSRRYAPLANFLIESKTWQATKDQVYQLLSLPYDGTQRLQELENEISANLQRLEKFLSNTPASADPADADKEEESDPQNATSRKKVESAALKNSLRLEGNKLKLRRYEANAVAPSLKKMRKLVGQKLPRIELIDLIMEVDKWLKFSQKLTHAQDETSCEAEQLPQLYAAIVAQACNLGLANMERMSGMSYSELKWVTNWYLRDDTLKEAITSLVNYQHSLPLAQYWGDGSFSSSDGQRFVVAVSSRSAAALPRYFGFGRGLTMLSWTADQYAVYGSKTVNTNHREALYTLDAILDNKSDLPIQAHTTDTGGSTEIVFALFDLLGMKFEPRLRDLSDQRLWRPEKVVVPALLKEAFKGNVIKSNPLLAQWDEMARLAGSLKLGYSSASLLISKLQAFPRQNALAKVLQEYGRLVKTNFILKFVEDEADQRRIGGQLEKGETVNGLRDYIFYGNKGQIRKHDQEEQLNQTLCTSLVMNCVIVWNTVYMALAVEALHKEGNRYTAQELKHLSPCRFKHINVLGKYYFDVGKIERLEGYLPLRDVIGREQGEGED